MYHSIRPNPQSIIINDTVVPLGKITVFEGPDGSGKTTLIREVSEHLTSAGFKPIILRFPDNRGPNRMFREMIMSSEVGAHPIAEAFLFLCDFIYTIEAEVKPHLLDDSVLFLFDRFIPSVCIYQDVDIERLMHFFDMAKFGEFRRILKKMHYVYLLPKDIDDHLKRLSWKKALDINRLDPTSVAEARDQVTRYATFAVDHFRKFEDAMPLLPTMHVTLLPV